MLPLFTSAQYSGVHICSVVTRPSSSSVCHRSATSLLPASLTPSFQASSSMPYQLLSACWISCAHWPISLGDMFAM